MLLLIGGDFCITTNYLEDNLFDASIIKIFEESDYSIVNLECPITPDEPANKIIKTGPNLRSDTRLFEKLKNLNVNAVTLANNHLMDYGETGLHDTLNGCKGLDIEYVGAGININEAAKPLYIEKEGIKIAFINFCENEWSIATKDNGGANPLDIIDNTKQIKKAKSDADFVIVIVHGGHEYYQLPSPRMVKQYRFFAENGADAIIGHHTHCVSGYEIYNNVPIVYSLGNFLFTIESKMEAWYTGLLAQLEIVKNRPISLKLIPLKQEQKTFKLSVLEGNDKELVVQKVEKLSKIIKDSDNLNKEWISYYKSNDKLIDSISPINYISNIYIRAILKRSGITRLLLNNNYLKSMINRFRCEAHRDLIIAALQQKIKKNNENRHS